MNKRLALCIGNNEYQNTDKLKCAVNDAVAMNDMLQTLSFDSSVVLNCTRTEMSDAVFHFYQAAKKGSYKTVLFYYAGHGYEVKNTNILTPIDMHDKGDPDTIIYEAFKLSEVISYMDQLDADTKIIILDACRGSIGRGTTETFAPIMAPKGTIIAFSTSPGQSAGENAKTGHGYYTEALLKRITLPRVPIETVFKKGREDLVVQRNGAQIPWEHTSLVGEFYFKPDMIFDENIGGRNEYSSNALADGNYKRFIDPKVKELVDMMKTHDYYKQQPAIPLIRKINFKNASYNDLFVLGRNIYQCAEGNTWDYQRFIRNFQTIIYIPPAAKAHILNGMAYEIYFDHEGKLRESFKTGYYIDVIKLLELPEYEASRSFIREKLKDVDDRPLYIPGQNEIIEITAKIEKAGANGHEKKIENIYFHGCPLLKSPYKDDDGTDRFVYIDESSSEFEMTVAEALVAPSDCVMIIYTDSICNSEVYAPANFILRY